MMTLVEILLLVILAVILVFGALMIVNLKIKQKMHQTILQEFNKVTQNQLSQIDAHHTPAQIILEGENKVFVIKTVLFNPKHELIITNKTYWCINENIKNWKRSATPNLIGGVKEFLDYKHPTEKEVIKIAIIYPGCYNRTRYLNESDVELVTYKKKAYEVYFLKFDEINDFFATL